MRNPAQLDFDFTRPCVFPLSLLPCFTEHLESLVNVMSFVSYKSKCMYLLQPKISDDCIWQQHGVMQCQMAFKVSALREILKKAFTSMCFQNKTDVGPLVSTRILSPGPRHPLTDAFCRVSRRLGWTPPESQCLHEQNEEVLIAVACASRSWLLGCLWGGLPGKEANWQATRQLVSFWRFDETYMYHRNTSI